MGTEWRGAEDEPPTNDVSSSGITSSGDEAEAGTQFPDLDLPWFVKPDPDKLLWRYMELSKYLSMLVTRSLWFARADKLGDPYEGSMSRANVKRRPEVYKEAIPGDVLKQMEDVRRKLVKYHYVNCWHCSEVESMAMWRLYMKVHGIAIITTAARMREAIDSTDDIYLSHVNYVDYGSSWIDEGNTFSPFLHKRRSFEHELEVRAIVPRIPDPSEGETLTLDAPSPEGLAVPANLNHLIAEVRVAPAAPQWFRDAVADVTARYGLTCQVSQSTLDGAAVY